MKRSLMNTTRFLALVSVLVLLLSLIPIGTVSAGQSSTSASKQETEEASDTSTPAVTPEPTKTPAPTKTPVPVESADDAYEASFKSKYYRTQKLSPGQWMGSADNRGYFAAIGVLEVRYHLGENELKQAFETMWSEAIANDTVFMSDYSNTVSVLYQSSDRYALVKYDRIEGTVELKISKKGNRYHSFATSGKKVSQLHFASAMAAVTAALGK